MALDDGEDEWDRKIKNSLRYSVCLKIKHPNIDPAEITQALGLIPNMSGLAGTRRITPRGTVAPSTHHVSVWSHWFGVERNRRFAIDVEKMIDRLEPHREFLHKIVDDGGKVNLVVNLPGDINIGDDFTWRKMARLCALRIDLGIEVFPDFN